MKLQTDDFCSFSRPSSNSIVLVCSQDMLHRIQQRAVDERQKNVDGSASDNINQVELERIQNTSYEEIILSFAFDTNGVLSTLSVDTTMQQPLVEQSKDGSLILGELCRVQVKNHITILAYNKSEIAHQLSELLESISFSA